MHGQHDLEGWGRFSPKKRQTITTLIGVTSSFNSNHLYKGRLALFVCQQLFHVVRLAPHHTDHQGALLLC